MAKDVVVEIRSTKIPGGKALFIAKDVGSDRYTVSDPKALDIRNNVPPASITVTVDGKKVDSDRLIVRKNRFGEQELIIMKR